MSQKSLAKNVRLLLALIGALGSSVAQNVQSLWIAHQPGKCQKGSGAGHWLSREKHWNMPVPLWARGATSFTTKMDNTQLGKRRSVHLIGATARFSKRDEGVTRRAWRQAGMTSGFLD